MWVACGLDKAREKTAVVSEQGEPILVVYSRRGLAVRLQRGLQSFGYPLHRATSVLEAREVLAREKIALILVAALPSGRLSASPALMAAEAGRELEIGTDSAGAAKDGYALCRQLRSSPETRQLPLVLAVSPGDAAALLLALDAGADYLLFVPCTKEDLLRTIRIALLNGAAPDPPFVLPGIEVIHRDRMCTVTAGRARLVRLLFSVYEDLLQHRAALGWAQAEVDELRKQLPRKRPLLKAGSSLPEVTQGIAHDLNNLMETIQTSVVALKGHNGSPVPYLAALEAALAQAETLVAGLQNFALLEKEELPLEAVNPQAIVREVLEATLLAERAPDIRVELRLAALPLIRSNPTVVSRCLSNLIWNAVQAMPSGGVLSVVGYAQGRHVILAVRDTGPGIPREDQERIFQPHFTTKSGHSGLGLSLVRGLLRRSGGEITVTGQTGRGSTFRLSFPVADSREHRGRKRNQAKCKAPTYD